MQTLSTHTQESSSIGILYNFYFCRQLKFLMFRCLCGSFFNFDTLKDTTSAIADDQIEDALEDLKNPIQNINQSLHQLTHSASSSEMSKSCIRNTARNILSTRAQCKIMKRKNIKITQIFSRMPLPHQYSSKATIIDIKILMNF